MYDNRHGTDVEEATGLETAGEALPDQDPGRDDASAEAHEGEATKTREPRRPPRRGAVSAVKRGRRPTTRRAAHRGADCANCFPDYAMYSP